MALDPWEILGIRHDAPLADVDAAYRRLVALFHPDHLRDLRVEARAEGERRFREATEAVDAIRARLGAGPRPLAGVDVEDPDVWSHHGLPDRLADGDEPTLAYNAQVRALGPSGLHATWPGRHAAGLYAALKRTHTIDGPVLQVEWGAYECTLTGRAVRALLTASLAPGDGDWRAEPLENLEVGRQRRRWGTRVAGPRPSDGLDLGTLADLLDERSSYLVTAEVFVGLE